MLAEVWRPIEGYEGYYSVSNLGRVRSEERVLPHNRCGSKRIPEKILKGRVVAGGYLQVKLYKNKKQKQPLIHRLVAQAFIDNPMNRPDVNHKNGDKSDNRLDNLEWCTKSENMQHAYANGLQTPLRGEQLHNSKLSESQVKCIRALKPAGMASKDIARLFNMDASSISHILSRKTWSHI